jgi:hypothetical protein
MLPFTQQVRIHAWSRALFKHCLYYNSRGTKKLLIETPKPTRGKYAYRGSQKVSQKVSLYKIHGGIQKSDKEQKSEKVWFKNRKTPRRHLLIFPEVLTGLHRAGVFAFIDDL